MNCIFTCVFNNKKYIDMFYLLLESIYIYGNLDDNTDIILYTSSEFMNIIKKSHLYNKKIKFELCNNYDNIDKACKARLDLFNLQSINNYDKILYLDTDILIKDDINLLFNLIKDDILYVLEEGLITDNDNYYGGQSLFGNEIDNYSDKSAFTSGIMVFNNTIKIKNLFQKINEDIKNRPFFFNCYDQPYIVYNSFKYNMYDNKVLKQYVVNNNNNINSNYIIHHFPGGPGIHENKIIKMTTFLNSIKDKTINDNIKKAKNYIDMYLLPIIKDSSELLEGNIFMYHHTLDYTDIFLNKTKNITNLVLNKNIKNVMEIGFNSGFSTLLMLLSNNSINVTCFDLGEHKYTIPCFQKLKETFGNRIEIIIGDSMKTLPIINSKYDLIHIDGGHMSEVAESDIINSYRLSNSGTILIMDDYDFPNLHELWDNYIKKYKLKKLDINLYETPHHDIKYVHKSTICLNMIVKNESHVILQTLNNLTNKINFDYWVIGDNGSSDGTQDIIINFFKEKNIPGELYSDKWIDFGHNRSEALKRAFMKTDYVFIFDADDKINGDIIIPNILEHDMYNFTMMSSNVKYTRPCMVNNMKRWKYFGVLHEYIVCVENMNSVCNIDGNYFIESNRMGARNMDPNKYINDAIVLENAYYKAIEMNDSISNRYVFYCANSYKDANKTNEAIFWYKKTLESNGWIQEKYMSCLYLFEMYNKLSQIEIGCYYLVKAYKYDSTRIEAIFELVKHYCIEKMNDVAYSYYSLIEQSYLATVLTSNYMDKLFIRLLDYYFYLPYYMIIVSERLKKHKIGIKMYEIIFEKKVQVGEWYVNNLMFNLQFFIDKINPTDNPEFWIKCESYINFLFSININVKDELIKLFIQYGLNKSV
jgi:predicted O-methyltransferase YrrM